MTAGPSSRGGIPGAARHESFWADSDGNPVEQGDPTAVFVEIVSYDADGNEIQRTYGAVDL